ncbi:hypothetical protein Ancab_007808 [Ancistrocladus abbreviatus]
MIRQVEINENLCDQWQWKHAKTGVYETEFSYQYLMMENSISVSGEFRKVLDSCLPRKISAFLWKARWVVLEDENHIFAKCTYAFEVWSRHNEWWGIQSVGAAVWPMYLHPCGGPFGKRLGAAILWHLWLARNNQIFQEVFEVPAAVFFYKAQVAAFWWLKQRSKLLQGRLTHGMHDPQRGLLFSGDVCSGVVLEKVQVRLVAEAPVLVAMVVLCGFPVEMV